MRRIALLFTILLSSAALPLFAQNAQGEPLGDVARQLRKERAKKANQPVRLFTNENLPPPVPGEAVTMLQAPPSASSSAAPAGSKLTVHPPAKASGKNAPESPEAGPKTRDYWQAKFQAARKDLAESKKLQQLAEDELNLLQLQELRELDPTTKANLATKVEDKQSEIDVNKATTEAAQDDLDKLERDFEESGAPREWSETEWPT